jgi:hypothetical protein
LDVKPVGMLGNDVMSVLFLDAIDEERREEEEEEEGKEVCIHSGS